MAQQLIYTSAPRGLVAGRSGYCTVARSESMRDSLVVRLEQLSRYVHVSLSGGQDRAVFACRIIDIRGERFHVLSRINAAGLDYAGRNTNIIAHHLAFTPAEIQQLPAPAVILRDWAHWEQLWNKEPQLIKSDDVARLKLPPDGSSLPAREWKDFSGATGHASRLLDCRIGTVLRVDDVGEKQLLSLLAESAELSAARDPRWDIRNTIWQQTFITSLQFEDDRNEVRWCGLHTDSPVFAKFGGMDCAHLRDLAKRSPEKSVSADEANLAESGWKAPEIIEQPKFDKNNPLTLRVRASGIPAPTFQWYKKAENGQNLIVPGETRSELTVRNADYGRSHYYAEVSNCAGNVVSDEGVISNNDRPTLRPTTLLGRPGRVGDESGVPKVQPPRKPAGPDWGELDKLGERYDQQAAATEKQDAAKRNTLLLWLVILVVGGLIVLFVFREGKHSATAPTPGSLANTNPADASTNAAVQPLPDNTNSPKSILSTNVPLASSSSTSPPAPPRQENAIPRQHSLPVFWQTNIIGHAVLSTALMDEKGTVAINSSGIGIYGTSDNFVFVNRTNSNDVTFTVNVSLLTAMQPRGQYGLMIRESSETNAQYAFIGVGLTPPFTNSESFRVCAAFRNRTVSTNNAQPLGDNQGSATLQLQYTGEKIDAALIDGAGLHLVGSMSAKNFPKNYFIGFAVFTGDTNKFMSVDFTTTNLLLLNP